MANRIETVFARLREQKQKAFVAYITAGDPSLDRTRELALCFANVGVDILELGVPFSDPLADGEVNQMAALRGLGSGTTVERILAMVRELRKDSQIPLVLFTYLNPIYNYGFARFHHDAAAAGVDGVLLLDLPPDEAERNADMQACRELARVQLVAPTTPDARIRKIVAAGSGFIYYVSREGVTGAQTDVAQGVAQRVGLIRSMTQLPVVVGFGVSTPDQVRAVAGCADGVVVGSTIVRKIAELGDSEQMVSSVTDFVRELVGAARTSEHTPAVPTPAGQ